MFIHDRLKIMYSRLGYLPGYPYHLISDKEMIEAFLPADSSKLSYFYDNYACPEDEDESIQSAYDSLVESIRSHLDGYLNNGSAIPDWIYSYMLGAVTGPNSSELDISYLASILELESSEQFTPSMYARCLTVSSAWVKKLVGSDYRPPTIFGEPHVIKSRRLNR